MIIYYILYIIVAANSFLIDKNRKLGIIGFSLFSLFYVFAARVGSDYPSYEIYFERMNSIKDLSVGGFEIGYNLLALFFHQLGLPFQVLHICIFGFIIFFFYQATNKMNLDLGITTLLALYYIFYPSLEALREGLALSMFFYSCSYLVNDSSGKDGNWKKYYIINGIGFLFHRTAIIAFAFYLFKKGKLAKIGVALFLVFFTIFQPFVLETLRRFPAFYNKVYYYIWLASIAENTDNSTIVFKLVEYTIALIVLLFIILKKTDFSNKIVIKRHIKIGGLNNSISKLDEKGNSSLSQLNNIESLAFNLIGLGLIIQVFISPILSSSYRLVYYCDMGILMFYSVLFRRYKNALLKIGYIFVLIIYIGIRFSRIFPFDNELFVYHFLY